MSAYHRRTIRVRQFLVYILFLLLPAVGLAQVPLTEPVSFWWYPYGNLEGTRQNITVTDAQPASSFVIKWRTPLLSNVPTLLVGTILPRGANAEQQIVGAMGNSTVAILSPFGLLEKLHSYGGEFPGLRRLTLTGLFNTEFRPIRNPGSRVNRIGIGIEQSQQPDGRRPAGALADSSAGPKDRLTIEPLTQPSPNNIVGIYPITLFRPSTGGTVVLGAVTQDQFTSPMVRPPVNSLRAYTLEGARDSATTNWVYPIAPRIYPHPPSILYYDDIARSRDSAFIGLATSSYSYDPATVATPAGAPPTRSSSAYSLYIGASPLGTRTYAADEARPDGSTEEEVHTYFVTLYASAVGSGGTYRVITRNYDAAHPGTASLRLVSADGQDNTDTLFVDGDMQNVGWRIVTGNIDQGSSGMDRNYLNNVENELIGAWHTPDNSDLQTNWIYLFRRNTDISPERPFALFAKQFFRGRLMAAGDLITNTLPGIDDNKRNELVTAEGSTVNILGLMDYNDPASAFVNPGTDPLARQYFRKLAGFTLDSRVVSVAIADIEGDGKNDLIVSTEKAVYAIGLRVPIPFGRLAADQTTYCAGAPIRINWQRRVGGGEEGVRIRLRGPIDTVIAENYHRGQSGNPVNPGIEPDSITLGSATLPPGVYRVRVEDPLIASLYDETASFTVNQPVITPVSVDTGSALGFGAPIHLSTTIACADRAYLLRSLDGSTWDTVRSVTMNGSSVAASDTLDCSAWCGGQEEVVARYRFVDPGGYSSSDTVLLRLAAPGRTLALSPGDTSHSRRRIVSWKAGDFTCDRLKLSISGDGGQSWVVLAQDIPASLLEYPFEVPDQLAGTVSARICCEAETASSCEYADAPQFEVNKVPDGNFVAPNPFNPKDDGSGNGNGAGIVYRLKETGIVSIVIFDASRSVTRRLMEGVEQEGGRRTTAFWDGRNSRGEIVANGTYICVIESSSGEHIVLPIIVMKRQ